MSFLLPRIIPNAFVLLSNWRYLEYSILRIIAGWGRSAGDWEERGLHRRFTEAVLNPLRGLL